MDNLWKQQKYCTTMLVMNPWDHKWKKYLTKTLEGRMPKLQLVKKVFE